MVGSYTAGVFEFETSSVFAGAAYAMNVRALPSVETFRANSDLEGKLVVTKPVGMASVFTSVPDGVIWSRNIGEVIPKLPSTLLLLNTLLLLPISGKAPESVAIAVPHTAVVGQMGGKRCPTDTEFASPV